MTSRTDIVNGALIKLGVQRIATLDEASEPARVAATVFQRVAKSELRKQAWSFSLASTALGRLADPAGGAFRAAYNLPTDLIRIVNYNDGWVDPTVEGAYTIEGRVLYSNDATARIRYVRDLSIDTALWDPAFVEAFTCRLAAEMGPTLTKDTRRVDRAKVEYKEALLEAKRTNAIELPARQVEDGSWVLARYDAVAGGPCAAARPISPYPPVSGGGDGVPYDFESLVDD